MLHTQVSEEIERPIETVFDFVATDFFFNYPRWSPEVESLEPLDGPRVAPGMRARQIRVDRGRRSETEFRVTALETPHRVRFEATARPDFAIEYRFARLDGGRCRLDFRFELRRLELYMRPFERLIRKAVHEGSETAVGNIKRLVEEER